MPEYRVEVEVSAIEVYYVDAENEDDARENYAWNGEYSHTNENGFIGIRSITKEED